MEELPKSWLRTGEIMSHVDEIKCIDLSVGRTVEGYSDHEVASLTPEELHKRFGGPDRATLRVAIMKLVHFKRDAEARRTKFEEEVLLEGKADKSEKAVDPSGSKRKNNKNELAYQKIVNGKTFGADTQLIEQLEKKLTNVKLVENTLDHKITILFCPISSRIGADVTAAMNEVKDKNPIILVLMNHSYEPRCVATQRTWDNYPNIEMFVHVFFHETKSGLIKCQQNDEAINILAGFCTRTVEDGLQAETPCENQLDQSASKASPWYCKLLNKSSA